jgi:hypothetical protein
MKAALKTRKRKHSAGKLVATRRGTEPATGGRTIPIATKSAKAAKHAGVSVMQDVYDQPGRPNAMIAIDASSPAFGEDLRSAFEKNVAKARRENKRRFGSADPQIFKGREP